MGLRKNRAQVRALSPAKRMMAGGAVRAAAGATILNWTCRTRAAPWVCRLLWGVFILRLWTGTFRPMRLVFAIFLAPMPAFGRNVMPVGTRA